MLVKFLLLFLALTVVASQNPYNCTETVAVQVVNYITFYTKFYFSCGWLGSGVCQKTGSYLGSFGTYMTEIHCCPGYGGLNCTAKCEFPECNDNEICIAPNHCGCIEGWTGYRCLTDVDECSLLTDECELRSSCNNTEGGYLCSCNYPDVLASDGRRCLSPASNFSATPNRRSISLSWSPPFNFTADGDIDQYSVYCNITGSYGSKIIEGDGIYTKNLSASLFPLSPFTNYSCCIEVLWTNGDISESSCVNVRTLEDSPGDPPQNVAVQSVDAMNLLINWQPPKLTNGIISSYTINIDYTNHSKIYSVTVDSDIEFFILGFLYPYQLVGVNMAASTGGGLGPFSDFEFNRTKQSSPGAVHNLNIAILNQNSINVTWHPPLSLNGIIISYHIFLLSTSEQLREWSLTAEDDLYVIVNDLVPYSPYQVEVKAATAIARGASAPFVFFTDQRIPGMSPSLTSDTGRLTPTTILFSWTGLTDEDAGGFLQYYTVSYQRKCDENEEILINTTDTSLQLYDLDPLEGYCFKVAAVTIKGTGPFSTPTLIQAYPSSEFYFHITSVYDCLKWTQSSRNSDSIVSTIKEKLTVVVNENCLCGVQPSYFQLNFTCDGADTNRVTVQGKLVRTRDYSSNELAMVINNWTNFTSIIVLDGVQFSLSNCDSNPTACQSASIGTQATHESTSSSSSTALSVSLGIIISSIITIVLFFGATALILYILKKRERRGPSNTSEGITQPQRTNMYSFTNPITEEETEDNLDDDFADAEKLCEASEEEKSIDSQ